MIWLATYVNGHSSRAMNSMRRLRARPSGVLLSAMGWVSP